ncbi:iron-siderophore ABC transporter substrate-binding protein [Rugosimonospora africana]|uniref:ABC transporter substrate-binding protein n=1 Tax=Rugosimonospora africana TaxID=556532 RepID=A0A8J3QZ53_9ACTN|nr:iron-siderophore ABC transporter substrate-binding protein [Rugosimonospora africana]GIH20055.1 ABC transporter substrate-binding protein [Rugosimonospora africana]
MTSLTAATPGRHLFPRKLAVLAATAVLVAAAACSPNGGRVSGVPGAGSSSAATFPVTIAHKFGSTTIKAQPKRIVAVGLTEQDALLALGVVPIATTKWLGAYPGEIGPWAKRSLGGAPAPTVLDDADGIQFEKIAALHPDLILALYSGVTQKDYTTLSAIAATVAPPAGVPDFGIGWDQATLTVGRAVGKQAEAQRLVDGVKDDFAAAREAHPEFAGKTAAMVTPYEGYFVYGRDDPRTRLLTGLGFTFPADLVAVTGDSYGRSISPERAALLDTDALVWLLDNPAADTTALHDGTLYSRQPVVRDGREVLVDQSADYGNAISFASVLSLPYVLQHLVPQLSAAVDGDPATKVPA